MKTQIIPKHKFDFEATDNLKQYKIEEIKEEIPYLLEWLQDGNWPVAYNISEYFMHYLNEIEIELMNILTSNDVIWKYWVLLMINASGSFSGGSVMSEIHRIAKNPTEIEIVEGLHETALEIIDQLNSKNV
ncbi:DUF5071 domain-containing protein [Flavobacterium sp. MFBS3-15]|uniref:DUF5071 domain-containing protein n=1 Tax=Flavobacterium sp. MFBS3-15 TaxID=2989816 RepID=UPI0022365905|nr:DUF5071 domain-containing protein [Flavobacterium sp. MFBS3-15]MCW4469965.1 DUF5071 domain-containing protein [Flavobacterium sp. MFBS3-15]